MRRMARTMRFHLDEHVPHAIAEGLRRRGIDVTTTVEAGLRMRLMTFTWLMPWSSGESS